MNYGATRIHPQMIEWTYDLHSDALRVLATSESLNLVNSTLHLTHTGVTDDATESKITADKMWAPLF
jgi:hypothetical protein